MPFQVDQPSFSGGEIGPGLQSRFDTAKYKTALRKGRNVLLRVEGGFYKRPGLRFVGKVYDEARTTILIPFQFSVEQSYQLEFGHLSMRVIHDGGYVLDNELIVHGITNAAAAVVHIQAHGYEVGDDVYFTAQEGMTEINGLIGRVTAVGDVDHVTVDIDTSAFGVWTASTGGVEGDAAGGEGGQPPPPVPGDPQPTFPDFDIDIPDTLPGFGGGTVGGGITFWF